MSLSNNSSPLRTSHSLSPFYHDSAIKTRISIEFRELSINSIPSFVIHKVPYKEACWHFVFRGPEMTPFEGGEYHGEINFPRDYPISPPLINFRTRNGRIICGKNISVIEDRWWDCSMTVRNVLVEVESIFKNGTPRPTGTIFEESYRLKIIAEKSKFEKCTTCKKSDRINMDDPEYSKAVEKWKAAKNNTEGEKMGNWWRELHEILVNNEEIGRAHV